MSLPDPIHWRRISPLLDELLELDADERAQQLAGLAQTDASLAAELRSLLTDNQRLSDSGFLAGRVERCAAEASEPGLAGLQLGDYVLQRPLGQGGSGSVWRAQRQGAGTPREVAVKLLHLSLLGHAAAERFRREGAILGRLTHPNIAALLDSGVTAAGQPYLVIELVEGEPIDAYCRRHRLGVDARLRLFLDVLSAVGLAHRQLVVHRDLKPSNVLVTHSGQVKLLDFGIAKLIDDDALSGDATELTRVGGRAFTPAYAAPEQFDGAPVSTATDVYALGVLLFQLLSGTHPTPHTGNSSAELARAVHDTEPRRLSRSWTQTGPSAGTTVAAAQLADERASTLVALRKRLAGDLDTIVAHMLRKAPSDRYATVEAVIDDIRRHLAHQPVSVRPDTWRYLFGKFVRRHRGAVLAASLATVAILAGIVGTVSQAQRAQQLAAVAQAERDRAVRELTRAEAASEFTNYLLSVGWHQPQSSLDLMARAERLIRSQYQHQPALRAQLQTMLAGIYVEADEGRRADALLKDAEAAAQASADAPTLAAVRCIQGLARVDGLDVEAARRLFAQALEVLRPVAASETSTLANCLIAKSFVESTLALDGQAALALADEALALLHSPRPGQRGLVHYARLARAEALNLQGRVAEAIAIYETVLAEQEALGRGRSTQTRTHLAAMASMLSEVGQVRRAAELQTQANEIDRELRGDDALAATSLGNLAGYLQEIGRADEARRLYEQALVKAGHDNNPALGAIISLSFARHWCEAGAVARCRDMVDASVKVLDPLLPPEHPRRANLALVQAMVAAAQGDTAGEGELLRRAIAVQQTAPGGRGVDGAVMARLARVELRLGKLDEAQALAGQALTLAQARLGGFKHSRMLGQALFVQGQVHAARGDKAAADQAWQQAAEHLHRVIGPQAPLSLSLAKERTGISR